MLEKLGITRESWKADFDTFSEMLKALIEGVKIYIEHFDDWKTCDYIQKQIKVIEKATDKSWEELKEVIC